MERKYIPATTNTAINSTVIVTTSSSHSRHPRAQCDDTEDDTTPRYLQLHISATSSPLQYIRKAAEQFWTMGSGLLTATCRKLTGILTAILHAPKCTLSRPIGHSERAPPLRSLADLHSILLYRTSKYTPRFRERVTGYSIVVT